MIMSEKYPATIEGLHEIIRRLRAPGGCPWDREQTASSLCPCLAEECAELIDAVDAADEENICEELGDVLMNAVFQAVLAEERGSFTLTDAIGRLNEKMIRRHRHVFGDAEAADSEAVLKLWDKIKASEGHTERKSLLDGIAVSLSALSTAEKMQKKVAKVGFDWNCEEQIAEKIREELAEYEAAKRAGDEEAADAELGDLLFAVANLVRFRKRGDSESLLRRSCRKFDRRFRYIEDALAKQNIPVESAGLERLEQLWQEAKTVVG